MNPSRPGDAQKKTGAINGRISGALRDRLSAINERFGVTDSTMLEDALTALADYVESAQKYERPFRVVNAQDYPEFESFFQLNEARRAKEIVDRVKQLSDPQAPYGQRQKKA